MPDMFEPVASAAIPEIQTPALPRAKPEDFDRILHAWQSNFTGGRSPSTIPLAFMDWAAHSANAPFTMAALGRSAVRQWQRLATTMLSGGTAVAPSPDDHRFVNAAWQQRPYNLLVQSVLLGEEWWNKVVQAPPGVSTPNARMVGFTMRQFLDLVSPSNIPWLNPEVIEATRASGGRNLLTGMENLRRDKTASGQSNASTGFQVGENLAATPGKIVFRNSLMELIQYSPATEKVGAEPVLIVPAWIMKYYILDLSANNSMIGWLVAQGRTVFCISWRNPDAAMHDTSLDDYRKLGVMAALDAVQLCSGKAKIHAAGYCLGGTLLSIAAAAMARDDDDRLASLSLFAAQTDFTEAGELQLFITEDQLSFLNDIMQSKGYLDSAQMSGAFSMLQSNDMLWSHAIRTYLLGETDAPFDLMAWNADGTRLPARMHIEYLRHMFLNNDLAEGRFDVGGEPLVLGDIKLPIFLVGTEHDHIAPWHSVFKLHFLNDGDITFVLTSGGHNAGIVSEPGHAHRHFRIGERKAGSHTHGPDQWQAETAAKDGSWWVEWNSWLGRHSTKTVAAPKIAAGIPSLGDAPGSYVLEA